MKEKQYDKALKDLILLVQLVNGSRISEAIEFTEKAILTGEKKLTIKAKKGSNERIMIMPQHISEAEISKIRKWLKISGIPSRDSVRMYCVRRFGINTHSLRYALITYLAKRGVSPQLITHFTGHRKMDFILRYTEKITAEQVILEIVSETLQNL